MTSLVEKIRRARRWLDRASTRPAWWALLALVDLALSVAIVRLVKYTEIDWVAYMQEVEGPLLHDQWDYLELRGDTGPLVYPAGFVWVFMGLRALTDGGLNIRRAQYLFAGFHAALVFLVLATVHYIKPVQRGPASAPGKAGPPQPRLVPFWVGLALLLSRRVHSIFGLRLFNDGVAMLLFFACTALLVRERWNAACVLFSLALSVKMNVMLFVPGLAVLLLETGGLARLVARGALMLSIQLALAFPFLAANPWGYIERAVEVGRVFTYKWTVNYKFLDEETFQSRGLALALTGATLLSWLAFGHKHFCAAHEGGLPGLLWRSLQAPLRSWRAPEARGGGGNAFVRHACATLFVSNFIGVAFFRSLHYQFYAWYFHTLPLLLHEAVHPLLGAPLLAVIELCFNVFPATPLSSAALQACHAVLLVALWLRPPAEEPPRAKTE